MSDLGTPSDVGRRLRNRREELGLSVETVASRAGIDPGYLRYLETSRVPNPTRGTVLRLALALNASPASVLGGDRMVPPGAAADGPPARLVELDRTQCMQLIAPGGVGRVVFSDDHGPVALPVNYALAHGDIAFRTGRSTSLATASVISFEVDRIDEAFREGWSVLVRGTAKPVDNPDALEGSLPVQPWASGERDRYFRLEPQEVTGRELRHD